MSELLFMEPVFKEAIWGGSRLKEVYGYDIPSDHTGECWAISCLLYTSPSPRDCS